MISVRNSTAWLAAAASLGLLAGCGSTVPYTGSISGPGRDASFSSPTPAGVADRNAPGSTGTLTAVPGTAAGSAPGSASARPAESTPSSGPITPFGAGPLSGRGFTAATVQVGVATENDANAFGSTVGIKGVSTSGDPNAQLDAVVQDVNRHGGLLGRKIILIRHDFNTAQVLSDPATANQAACADWTQDHHVFAVLEPPVVESTLLNCLAQAQTPLIYAGGIETPLHYQATYRKFPLFFNIGQMVGDRFDRVAIGRLVARHFFDPWDTLNGKPGTSSTPTKLGLLGTDDSDGAVEIASVEKVLARYGIKPADVVLCPRAIQDAVSCQQSAVLKLHSDGVTHIFGAGYPFMINADKQQYHPRYFLAIEPRVYAQNAPATQLMGSMGEGYIPVMDVEPTEYPGDPTPATAHCKRVMESAAQGTTDPTTEWSEDIDCDTVYFLQVAVEAGGIMGTAAFRAGFERLGVRQPSALTWGTMLDPNDHASATVLRDIAFQPSTKRFAYTGTTNYGDH